MKAYESVIVGGTHEPHCNPKCFATEGHYLGDGDEPHVHDAEEAHECGACVRAVERRMSESA